MPASLAHAFLSLVVPPLCVACREPELSGAAVCPPCAAQMIAITSCCVRCAAPLPCSAPACSECRGRDLAFERAWAPFTYTGPAREVVLGLKGRGLTAAARYMAEAIAGRAQPALPAGILVPAPAHPERMRRHGTNQARALAEALGRVTGSQVRDVLARRPGGARQVGLARHARGANARGSIRVRARLAESPPVVLVDDVYTTGSTLDACALALKGSGSGPVIAVCFARTVLAPGPVAQRPAGA
jgi:predicted amidophosphoribosyltransferase